MEQTASEGQPLQRAIRRPETAEEKATRRERERRYRRYRCYGCDSTYKDEWEAANCCWPDEVYVCPTCNEVWTDAVDAEACEKKHAKDSGEVRITDDACCPVCDSVEPDLVAAVEHCLWKTHGIVERLQIVDHLRFGRVDLARAMIARH